MELSSVIALLFLLLALFFFCTPFSHSFYPAHLAPDENEMRFSKRHRHSLVAMRNLLFVRPISGSARRHIRSKSTFGHPVWGSPAIPTQSRSQKASRLSPSRCPRHAPFQLVCFVLCVLFSSAYPVLLLLSPVSRISRLMLPAFSHNTVRSECLYICVNGSNFSSAGMSPVGVKR